MHPVALAATLIIVGALGIALIVAVLWRAAAERQPQVLYAGKDVTFLGDVAEPTLREAYIAAENCLSRVWGRAVVEKALEGLQIWVTTPKQHGPLLFCGFISQSHVAITSEFTSLFHVLAHQVERYANGQQDRRHASWEELGVWVQDRRYREWVELNKTDAPHVELP